MKINKLIAPAALVAWAFLSVEVSLAANIVKTYLPFTFPIDPVKIVTIADMDISYALGATLVEWGKDKQVVGGLAAKWESTSNKVLRFQIRAGQKWSDGSTLTSHQVRTALEAAFKRFPDDLRAVRSIIEAIRTPSDQLIDFHLKVDVAASNLLGKLTEPQYAIFTLKSNSSEVDPRKTLGPFFVENMSPSEVTFSRNPNWMKANSDVADKVIVRPMTSKIDSSSVLLNDEWANIVETSSMISENTLKTYKEKGFQIWTRPLDKMLYFQLGKRIENQSGLALLRYLRLHLDRKILSKELSGIKEANQAFPVGFQLHNPNMACSETQTDIPEEMKNKNLRILISPARVGPQLKANLIEAVTKAIGTAPRVDEIELSQLSKARMATDYDLYFGTMGLADPDPEGAMSFYFEGDMPIIPSVGKPFIKDLDLARKLSGHEKLDKFRSILTEGYCGGHFLPVFHLSTVGIAKPEIDLSSLDETDESVTLSKIRFKGKSI